MQQTEVLMGEPSGGRFQKTQSRDVARDVAGQDQISETWLSLLRHAIQALVLRLEHENRDI